MVWAADLTEVGSLSSKNQGIKYLLFIILFYNILQKPDGKMVRWW